MLLIVRGADTCAPTTREISFANDGNIPLPQEHNWVVHILLYVSNFPIVLILFQFERQGGGGVPRLGKPFIVMSRRCLCMIGSDPKF